MITTDPPLKALWLAVEAAPDCRLTRGVYADALQEAGEYWLAEACRATADKWPQSWGLKVYWVDAGEFPAGRAGWVAGPVFRRLTAGKAVDIYRDYDTARAALHDLWRAWVRVNKGGEG